MTQVEVIAQEGPEQRTATWMSRLRALTGDVPTGNVDLMGRPMRVDPNFFALFENTFEATKFRQRVFESGLSRAVYLVGEDGKFVPPPRPVDIVEEDSVL